MTIPELTVTILGATGSGKTTFLLSAGLHGYFAFAELPSPDAVGINKYYRFVAQRRVHAPGHTQLEDQSRPRPFGKI
jgi:hypothetical protein